MGQALPEIIDGWFAIAASADVPRGAVRAMRLMGNDLAVFRTLSGELAAVDAACPHLGASLPTVGRVEGEVLRCGAHGFCFDVRGDCVATGYGTAPPRVGARTYAVRERLGLIFAWHHHRHHAPSWDLPEWDLPDWSTPSHALFRIPGHPQEVVENGVDTGHFAWIHGFSEGDRVSPLRTDGHRLALGNSFLTAAKIVARRGRTRVRFEFEAFGLGVALIESSSPELGLRARSYVLPTPVGNGEVEIRFVNHLENAHEVARHLPLIGRLVPAKLGARAIHLLMHRAAVSDFRKDVRYWSTKRYLERPGLAKGDGPILAYRKWARQFYPIGAGSLPVVAA